MEKTSPYSTNKQAWTKNSGDQILAGGAKNNDDPIVNYVMLGNKVEDGLFGWITIGIDTTLKKTINTAAWYGEGGAIKNPADKGIYSFSLGGKKE